MKLLKNDLKIMLWRNDELNWFYRIQTSINIFVPFGAIVLFLYLRIREDEERCPYSSLKCRRSFLKYCHVRPESTNSSWKSCVTTCSYTETYGVSRKKKKERISGMWEECQHENSNMHRWEHKKWETCGWKFTAGMLYKGIEITFIFISDILENLYIYLYKKLN